MLRWAKKEDIQEKNMIFFVIPNREARSANKTARQLQCHEDPRLNLLYSWLHLSIHTVYLVKTWENHFKSVKVLQSGIYIKMYFHILFSTVKQILLTISHVHVYHWTSSVVFNKFSQNFLKDHLVNKVKTSTENVCTVLICSFFSTRYSFI